MNYGWRFVTLYRRQKSRPSPRKKKYKKAKLEIPREYFMQRWGSSIQAAKTRPGVDCGLDHELFIGKFRLKLKKVGKTTRPFRYDLNQITHDYIAEVTDSRD